MIILNISSYFNQQEIDMINLFKENKKIIDFRKLNNLSLRELRRRIKKELESVKEA
jgi:hypothetical protein